MSTPAIAALADIPAAQIPPLEEKKAEEADAEEKKPDAGELDAKKDEEPEMDAEAIRKEAMRQAAIDRYNQKTAKKEADYQQEWLMRQRERRKDISILPNSSDLAAKLEAAKPMLAKVALGFEDGEIKVIAPFAPHYSRDMTNARRYKDDEAGPEKDFLALFDELVQNYKEGMARFRALNWFPDEDLVFVASRETNDLRHDSRDDVDDLIALTNSITVQQTFHIFLQDFKRHLDELYFMRTGSDTLLRQWLRTREQRDDWLETLEGVEGEEERRKKLFEKMGECFKEQGLEVPEEYQFYEEKKRPSFLMDDYDFMDREFEKKMAEKKMEDEAKDKEKEGEEKKSEKSKKEGEVGIFEDMQNKVKEIKLGDTMLMRKKFHRDPEVVLKQHQKQAKLERKLRAKLERSRVRRDKRRADRAAGLAKDESSHSVVGDNKATQTERGKGAGRAVKPAAASRRLRKQAPKMPAEGAPSSAGSSRMTPSAKRWRTQGKAWRGKQHRESKAVAPQRTQGRLSPGGSPSVSAIRPEYLDRTMQKGLEDRGLLKSRARADQRGLEASLKPRVINLSANTNIQATTSGVQQTMVTGMTGRQTGAQSGATTNASASDMTGTDVTFTDTMLTGTINATSFQTSRDATTRSQYNTTISTWHPTDGTRSSLTGSSAASNYFTGTDNQGLVPSRAKYGGPGAPQGSHVYVSDKQKHPEAKLV